MRERQGEVLDIDSLSVLKRNSKGMRVWENSLAPTNVRLLSVHSRSLAVCAPGILVPTRPGDCVLPDGGHRSDDAMERHIDGVGERGPPQGDLRLSGPPSGQGAGSGARTRDRRVPADLRADSQATVLPTPH
ncbi:hypothetical protein PoB_007619900 [Plakobranchus ocellatus]|uniref:Uncharacterized protein n=1 Tax=Plakobranchus ocellatus TaxID=259542 RepID=A0AAV4E031_9GAST|nr:hypothetical protein PoB_007619900 [Plakobranchus ocellatus]